MMRMTLKTRHQKFLVIFKFLHQIGRVLHESPPQNKEDGKTGTRNSVEDQILPPHSIRKEQIQPAEMNDIWNHSQKSCDDDLLPSSKEPVKNK